MDDKKSILNFNQSLDLLKENLSFLLESYLDLRSFLEEEKKFLVACDLKSLNENRYHKELLLTQIEEIEQRRVLRVKEMEATLGLKVETLNLQTIIQNLGKEAVAQELSFLQTELNQVFDQVVNLNSEK